MTRALVVGLGLLFGGCTERIIYLRLSDDGETDDGTTGEPLAAGDPCEDEPDCGDGLTCFQGTCVGTGELRVSLSWEVRTDFDLHVRTPSGAEVDYETPEAGGGKLDVDDCVSGICQQPGGTHVENVVFGSASPGRYDVWVVNFDGRREGDFVVEIAGAHDDRYEGRIGRPPYDTSEIFSFEL